MRHQFTAILAATLALAGHVALAQTLPDPEQLRRLTEQKIKLVDMLVNSPRAQAGGANQDAETAALVERAGELLKQAREALAAQRYADATPVLDAALQSISKANSRTAGGLSDSAQKQRLQEMSEQVAAYRSSLSELAAMKGAVAASARAALAQADALAGQGRTLAAAGRLGDANKKMAQAYQLEVQEVSRLRAGQEVVMSLKFDTPADEYAYEQKRFQSSETLVAMMIVERGIEGERRLLVDRFVGEAVKFKDEAVALARSSRHTDAVAAMENAALRLNRALQAMGIPAF